MKEFTERNDSSHQRRGEHREFEALIARSFFLSPLSLSIVISRGFPIISCELRPLFFVVAEIFIKSNESIMYTTQAAPVPKFGLDLGTPRRKLIWQDQYFSHLLGPRPHLSYTANGS